MSSAPPSPLASMRRRWKSSALLAALGLVLGVLAGLVLPVTYTAESRLAVAPNRNSAYTISGFPLAATELAANYARWVHNNAADGSWRPAGVESVVASPVPESAIVRIETTGPDEQAVVAGADQVAAKLEAAVSGAQSQNDPQRAYDAFQKRAPEVAKAETAVDNAESAYQRALAGNGSITRAQTALEEARAEYAQLKLAQDGDADLYRRLYSDTQGITQLQRLGGASSMGSNRSALVQRGAVVGLFGGLLAGLVLSVVRDRRGTPRRGDLAVDHDRG